MPAWKKVIVSGSDASLNSLSVTQNVTAQSFTGSLFGTSSYTEQSLSSSYAVSSSYSNTAQYVINQYFATFTQSIAATTWTFDHNLSQRTPVVTVYDNDYNVIIPKNIRGQSENQLVITFDSPVSGYASATIGSILPVSQASQESLALAYAIAL